MVSAKHLVRRLLAVVDALQDIPATRCALHAGRPIPSKSAGLSAGAPYALAGRRDSASGPMHEVDEILKECDWLARLGNPQLDDTS